MAVRSGIGKQTRRILQGTGVADDPQLGSGVVDVGVGGEGASSVSAGAVVVLITDVVRVLDGFLGGHGEWK